MRKSQIADRHDQTQLHWTIKTFLPADWRRHATQLTMNNLTVFRFCCHQCDTLALAEVYMLSRMWVTAITMIGGENIQIQQQSNIEMKMKKKKTKLKWHRGIILSYSKTRATDSQPHKYTQARGHMTHIYAAPIILRRRSIFLYVYASTIIYYIFVYHIYIIKWCDAIYKCSVYCWCCRRWLSCISYADDLLCYKYIDT